MSMSNVIIGNSNTTLLIAQYYFHQILYKLLLVLNRQLGFSFKSVKPNFTSPTLISSLLTILACGTVGTMYIHFLYPFKPKYNMYNIHIVQSINTLKVESILYCTHIGCGTSPTS